MSQQPTEVEQVHTRLLKCTLEVEEARAYWQRVDPDDPSPRAQRAFAEYWFGARSMPRVEVLIQNFRARFDAYPEALAVLRRWNHMDPRTRALICHFHLQLSDPLYRSFTGVYLAERRDQHRPDISRAQVITWVEHLCPERWTMSTRVQFASKLLSSAYAAGLIAKRRDPRPLCYPRVEDHALTYLLYLLRHTRFHGTLLENPYLASVGLTGSFLEHRLRKLPALHVRRMGDVVDFGWRHASLGDWAQAALFDVDPHQAENFA